jgi:hypothetical protein
VSTAGDEYFGVDVDYRDPDDDVEGAGRGLIETPFGEMTREEIEADMREQDKRAS